MGNVTLSNANSTFSYIYKGGSNVAQLRVPIVGINYSQNSQESHARTHRAFYPHRRSQGTFNIVADCKGWREFNSVMGWFRNYATAALDMDAGPTAPPMSVSVPSRDFNRVGIPVKGLQFGDYIGSMVFSPQIQFLSVSDPNDPTSGVLTAAGISNVVITNVDPASNFFYPDSWASYPGEIPAMLYDQNQAVVTSAQALADSMTAAKINNKLNGRGI